MLMKDAPIRAVDVAVVKGQTIYPKGLAHHVAGRAKRKLGDLFGLKNFGVNLTCLDPGAASALLHAHATQDEFVFILEGNPTLIYGSAEHVLAAGECMGFRAGTGIAHQLVNRSDSVVTYIEIGDRSSGDNVVYPKDDIVATLSPEGAWKLTHKNGDPY